MKTIKAISIGLLSCLLLSISSLAIYIYFINVDTQYAPRYSESAFSKIGKGMNKGEVLDLLGEPLTKYPRTTNQMELWVYATQGENKRANYHFRTVKLEEDGSVYGTYSNFEID